MATLTPASVAPVCSVVHEDVERIVGVVRDQVARAGNKGHVAPVGADRRAPAVVVRKHPRQRIAHQQFRRETGDRSGG
jgi:hypothetical protein